jgi:hypothetical protein
MTSAVKLRDEVMSGAGSCGVSAEDLKACAELVGQGFVDYFADYFARRLPQGASESTEGVPAISPRIDA